LREFVEQVFFAAGHGDAVVAKDELDVFARGIGCEKRPHGIAGRCGVLNLCGRRVALARFHVVERRETDLAVFVFEHLAEFWDGGCEAVMAVVGSQA
jgi:hypothetical protein